MRLSTSWLYEVDNRIINEYEEFCGIIIYWKSSWEQPTAGGPPGLELDIDLITFHCSGVSLEEPNANTFGVSHKATSSNFQLSLPGEGASSHTQTNPVVMIYINGEVLTWPLLVIALFYNKIHHFHSNMTYWTMPHHYRKERWVWYNTKHGFNCWQLLIYYELITYFLVLKFSVSI
jgi:hypothetical protein